MSESTTNWFGRRDPDARGYYGAFGGRFVPETLVAPIEALESEYLQARKDPSFEAELTRLLAHYVGRPTPLWEAERLSAAAGGARIFLKREDLTHTGAHKINNALGPALLAKRMGKTRVVAETEYPTSERRSSSIRMIVVFPPPDGEEMMSGNGFIRDSPPARESAPTLP